MRRHRGNAAERQHLEQHLADKWSERELGGARAVAGPPLPPCPASPGVPGLLPPREAPLHPAMGPGLRGTPGTRGRKGREGLQWQARTLIPQSGFSFLFL